MSDQSSLIANTILALAILNIILILERRAVVWVLASSGGRVSSICKVGTRGGYKSDVYTYPYIPLNFSP